MLASGIMKIEELRAAAERLGTHPQDHGWREFFRLVGHGLGDPAGDLADVLMRCARRRPAHSASHLINLFGISLKSASPGALPLLYSQATPADQAVLLNRLVRERADEIVRTVEARCNSFTGTRRFLVPQVVLGAYFSKNAPDDLCFADFGTGLGIMPRQLNSSRIFAAFNADLRWPGGSPDFQVVPISRTFGVDRSPLPDLQWVRECYGTSAYYDKLFNELTSTLEILEADGNPVDFVEVDLLDTDSLMRFLRDHSIHAGNLSYVLYEMAEDRRRQIVDTIREGLRPPGLLIVTEPHAELSRQGCDVLVYCADRPAPYRLCSVSDGHFTGEVTALEDYEEFTEKYPIPYDLAA